MSIASKSYQLKAKNLSQAPGVYLFKDKSGKIIYVGKAGNLRRRVSSYFQKTHTDSRITKLVSEISAIDFRITPTVIEALILEAELIKKLEPKFNIREKDNKSFLYVVFTREQFSKPTLIRGTELNEITRNVTAVTFRVKHKKLKPNIYNLKPNFIFGPFTSASSIRAALHILRRIFPYSTCKPVLSSRAKRGDQKKIVALFPQRGTYRNDKLKPCFNYQIGLCPGVCVGAISREDYMKNIENLILFFRGGKKRILSGLKNQMKQLSKEENFEQAGKLRSQIYALEHIRDIALIQQDNVIVRDKSSKSLRSANWRRSNPCKDRHEQTIVGPPDDSKVINIFGRVEGYDISNISGTSAVGSMIVFQNGEPDKSEYRKFRIKTVRGANDIAMLHEVLKRRFAKFQILDSRFQILPDLIIIDGGLGQVNITRQVLKEYKLNIPIIGIAKGFMRKQDRPVFDANNPELMRIVENYKELLLQVRDESHRFAIQYHRKIRAMNSLS